MYAFVRVSLCTGVTPGVKVFLDDERIKIKNFEVSARALMIVRGCVVILHSCLLHAHSFARARTHVHTLTHSYSYTRIQEYCNMYLKSVGSMSESGEVPKSVHLKCNDRWELVIAVSDGQFQQVRVVMYS